MDYFKFYGRDIETLLAKLKSHMVVAYFVKMSTKKRLHKKISIKIEMFTDNKEVKNRADKQSFVPFMYV